MHVQIITNEITQWSWSQSQTLSICK